MGPSNKQIQLYNSYTQVQDYTRGVREGVLVSKIWMAPLPLIKRRTLIATIIWTVLTFIHYWLCAGIPTLPFALVPEKPILQTPGILHNWGSTEPQRINERQKLLCISETFSLCARHFWVTTYKRQNAAASLVLSLSGFCSRQSYSPYICTRNIPDDGE